jgi:hypothetical protein
MRTPTKREIQRLFNNRLTDAEAEHLAEAPRIAADEGTENLSPAQEDFLRDAGVLDD